jgi:hypothetical protein
MEYWCILGCGDTNPCPDGYYCHELGVCYPN